ncbi:MAG: hypothetical protein V4692_12625 [Bdellovibrionota bacterium]
MKAILLAVSFLLTVSSQAALADESGRENGPNSICQAYTTCSDGRQINCRASGNSCEWSYETASSVSCTGYDDADFSGAAHESSMSCD